MPHYVASDLGLHCLPMTFYGFPGKNGLKEKLLSQKQNISFTSGPSMRRNTKINVVELLPLKVYPFTLMIIQQFMEINYIP